MKIAILGAGFAGLATAWHLLENNQVTLFDPVGIGGEASSMSAGLLHPYVGLHAKYNPFGRESYEETLKLLQIASNALDVPAYINSGLLRPALSDQQKLDFRICSDRYSDTEWLSPEKAQSKVSALSSHPALWIKSGVTVYPELYTHGLGKTCLERGMRLEKRKVLCLQELSDYETIIVATGPQTLHFPELSHLRLNLIKGQILEVAWPQDLQPLSMPVNSQAYIVMNRDGKSCIIGSTYERSFSTIAPDLNTAQQEIMPKAIALIPALADMSVLGCRAGVRVSAPGHLPLIQRVSSNIWVFTGLGSKGLLYHAFYAKKLASQIIQNTH